MPKAMRRQAASHTRNENQDVDQDATKAVFIVPMGQSEIMMPWIKPLSMLALAWQHRKWERAHGFFACLAQPTFLPSSPR
jgi:hypothetical protein